MKYVLRIFFLGSLLSSALCPLVFGVDNLDDFDIDSIQISLEDIERIEQQEFRNPIINKGAILVFLIDKLNITQPIWKNTRSPQGRDTLYLLPHKIGAIRYGGFAGHMFFNMTNKMDVSVESLLNLRSTFAGQEEFIKAFVTAAFDLGSADFSSLIPLFEKIVIQERKSGLFLQGGFIRGPLNIQLHSSFQVSARNFWLSEKDQAIIRDLFPGQELDDDEFFKIGYGFGDTRMKIGLNALDTTRVQLDVGCEAIFPTSRISGKTNFKTPPTVLGNNFDTEQGATLLRSVRDILLNPRLGNGGHFALGCFLESRLQLIKKLMHMWIRISYDRLFEDTEPRLIMYKKTMEASEFNDGSQLDDFIQQFIFPTAFNVTTRPGGIFNLITSFNFTIPQWTFTLGYDLYAQQRERIQEVLDPVITYNQLRIRDAEFIGTTQHKIFSEVTYGTTYRQTELFIGLGGDVTAHSRGIGYDWTAYLKIAGSF